MLKLIPAKKEAQLTDQNSQVVVSSGSLAFLEFPPKPCATVLENLLKYTYDAARAYKMHHDDHILPSYLLWLWSPRSPVSGGVVDVCVTAGV